MRWLMLAAGLLLLTSLGCTEKNPRTVAPNGAVVSSSQEGQTLPHTTTAMATSSAAGSANAGSPNAASLNAGSANAGSPNAGLANADLAKPATTVHTTGQGTKAPTAQQPAPKSPPREPMIAVLPNGPTGQLLWERLTPTPRPGILANPARQPRSFAWARETALEPLLPPVPAPMPRLPRTVRPVRPQPAFEEALAEDFAVPRLPARPGFTPSERVRDSGEDARLAPPLPYLASPPVDRVPLDDPTLPAATRAILAAPIPVRSKAMPFEPIRLPEPYEFRQPQVTPQPEEETTPAVR
jgi:hypothetical protein